MKEKLPYMQSPCKTCPFRKDTLQGWLGEQRMTGILKQDSFVCHKTTFGKERDKRQCAGHILIKGEANTFAQLATRLGYDLDMKGQDLVFDNEQDCIKHHK